MESTLSGDTSKNCTVNSSVASKGLTLVPKLKVEHVQLTQFSRMRVDLTAQVCSSYVTACFYFIQVFSKSVADALAYFGDESTTETENFIKMFDHCLNVRIVVFLSGSPN